LLVIGGGPVGCELAQAFQRLGSRVTLIESGSRLLAREDPEAAAVVTAALERDGVRVLPRHRVSRFRSRNGSHVACLEASSEPSEAKAELTLDAVLVAVGRRAATTGLGLDRIGVRIEEDGRVRTDAFLVTDVPTILACGDVTNRHQLTHAAGHDGWYAAVNALLQPFWRLRAEAPSMPRCTFTEPEVARVGLTSQAAREAGIAHELTRYDLSELDRAIIEERTDGFIQVLTPPGSDQILGVTIVSDHAGEMLGEWSLAVRHGLGLRKILSTVHPYPTFGEASRAVASAWARKRAPTRMLAWLETFQALRRRRYRPWS
jgi:pyruvate/2-oxoglutarate dehydrogenase complex dihydrolipoamide dehydrogenase (E3) component